MGGCGNQLGETKHMNADRNDLLLARFNPRSIGLRCVAWAPDGNLLAVGGDNGILLVITPQGEERLWLSEGWFPVWCVAFAPNGKYIASGYGGGTAQLWSSIRGDKLRCLHDSTREVFGIAFGAGGKTVATAATDSSCRLWNCHNGREIAKLSGHNGMVTAIAASADGHYFASGGSDKIICLWNARSGKLYGKIVGHQGSVRGLAFSPDGATIASASEDKTIRLWQIGTGTELARFNGHENEVKSVAFCPSGKYLASGSNDNTVRLWHIATGVEIACLHGHTGEVNSVAFSPDGNRVASVSGDGTFCLWDTSNLANLCVKAGPDAFLSTWLTRQAATLGCSLAPVQIEDVWVPQMPGADGKNLLGVLQTNYPKCNRGSVALSPDGHTLYRGTYNGQLEAWDLHTGAMLWACRRNFCGIYDMALSSNGAWLACASADHTIHLWDAESGMEHSHLTGHKKINTSVIFSPDGTRLASTSLDKTILLWDTVTWQLVTTMRGHQDGVNCVAFSHDGSTLVSASRDGSIRLWDYHTGWQTAILHQQSRAITAIAFAPNDASLAFADDDEAIYLLDWASREQKNKFIRHKGNGRYLAFSPDGARLATSEREAERTIRIWDISNGAELQRFVFPEGFCGQLVWSGNGAFLAASLDTDTLRIFDTRPSLSSAAPSADPSKPLRLPIPLPQIWVHLLPHWQMLQQLQIAAPLSLLLDLQALLAKDTPPSLQALANHPSLNAIQRLNWPAQARLGILALLLNQWPGSSDWQTLTDMSIAEARQSLENALSHATPCEPAQPAPPMAWLTQSLNQFDERLLTLLTALGPQAVANDPGLPLRLLPQIANLSNMTQKTQIQRQSLCQALASLDRAGLSVHGAITALVPSQWTYPSHLLHWRHLNGGLLYRTRIVRKPPQLRPMVILLDTSPACWGLIEALTRPAAHSLAETLACQQLPALLLTAGDNQLHYLNQPAERLQLFTHRSQQPVDIQISLAKAQSLCCELADGKTEPIILLLTHCWWGAELVRSSAYIRQQSLRALFVQYSKMDIHPPFADQCERWETLHYNQFNAVADALSRLIS